MTAHLHRGMCPGDAVGDRRCMSGARDAECDACRALDAGARLLVDTEIVAIEPTPCPDCSAPVVVYPEHCGLLPWEEVGDRGANHSWLVCQRTRERDDWQARAEVAEATAARCRKRAADNIDAAGLAELYAVLEDDNMHTANALVQRLANGMVGAQARAAALEAVVAALPRCHPCGLPAMWGHAKMQLNLCDACAEITDQGAVNEFAWATALRALGESAEGGGRRGPPSEEGEGER